jgi:multidrug efflux pump subunit AcrA (membrane-fusion protein)
MHKSLVLTAGVRRSALFSLVLIAGVAGCNTSAPPEKGAGKSQASSADFKETSMTRRAIVRFVEQPGMVQAFEETQLFARVPGYIAKVLTDIGQEVKGPKYDKSGKEIESGQLLAEVAVPEMEEEANHKRAFARQTEAEVDQAKKALIAAEANIGAAEASVIEAKALRERWESESVRISALAKNGVIDAQTRDEVQNQRKAAGAKVVSTEAAVRKAIADRDRASADVKAAEARVDVAKAEVRRLEALLAYSKIRAPYDGMITVRKANTGDLVQPAAGKEWMFTIARLDPVRIVVAVPEADASLVQDKAAVKLSIKAAQETPLEGTVARISWALDAGSRTLRAEIDLPNKDGRLRPGMYVYANIKGVAPETWTLPTSAVVKQGDGMACYQILDGKAMRIPVQIGRNDGQFIEIKMMQRHGSARWEACNGDGSFALKAAGLTDGQSFRNLNKAQ